MTLSSRRVLFLAWAPFFSGAERALVRALRALKVGQYEPVVLAGTEGELASQVRALGVPCEIVPLHQLDRRRPLASVRSVAAVVRAALRHRVALIHSNDVPSFQAGGYTARLRRLPAVTHVRFPDTAAGYRWFLRPGFTRAIFVSEDQRNAAIGEAPDLFDGRSDVLHDCVERQDVWTAEQRAHVRRNLGLSETATLVAIIGQVAEVKGIWDFVDAARLVARDNPSSHFVVVGDDLKTNGAVRRTMQERVAALDLGPRFSFLGFRADASYIAQAFDIIAVPSLVEPFGLAALEGMAASCAVVASRVGGLQEIVVHQRTGLLCQPGAPTEFAAAIGRLIRDEHWRRALASSARNRAQEVFGIDAYGAKLRRLYDGVCAGHVSSVPNSKPPSRVRLTAGPNSADTSTTFEGRT
jgi:glycosyltransferase involved in cell wall biosynthesis